MGNAEKVIEHRDDYQRLLDNDVNKYDIEDSLPMRKMEALMQKMRAAACSPGKRPRHT